MMQKILIVDDVLPNVLLLEGYVKRLENVEAVTFTNPAEALAWCATNEPDLVMLDYLMPEMDGCEFLHQFRNMGHLSDVPVVIVTIDQSSEALYRALDAGANDFLRKPVDDAELIARVQNMLLLRARQLELQASLRGEALRGAALRESESNLVKAQRLAKIGNWRWSIERNELAFCSDEYARIHGVTPEEIRDLMKRQIERVIHPEDRDRVAKRFREADEDGFDYEIEYRIVHPNGDVRYVLEIGEIVIDATGRPVEHIGTLQDVTERKNAEVIITAAMAEAEIANRTKSEFLANMSHELRTPLNAIIGFSEIIKDQLLGPVGSTKYRDYAVDIHRSGQHLLGIINGILDLSKVESGADELHEENIEISEIANTIMSLVKGLARTGNIELELDMSDDVPVLHADERKVQQILLNLLSNAIKFTPDGGKVTLKIWSRAESGYVFQVIDTGIGMAFEDIPMALAPFQQIDSGLNRKHDGTGLGLPLTKSLVELHGGYLDLQSEVGVGTTVTVCFPAERIIRSPRDTEAVGGADRKAG